MLIINADDLGRTMADTDAALKCFQAGRITSASFMVFMSDSERAARLVQTTDLDLGLHLNFTEEFAASYCPPDLIDSQNRLAHFLKRNRYAPVLYNPLLRKQFAESCRAQVVEFIRLFGWPPSHVDGHHHMHLCANLLWSNFLPAGTKMRRNFSFWPGEKSGPNRLYRGLVDRWLARRYRLPDYFFALPQLLQSQRLDRALALTRTATVELMTHPAVAAESKFLMSDAFLSMVGGLEIGSYREF
jgi:chitin disaccharide deacetylase